MEDKKIVVAIDGPAGAGKSTVARAAAGRLGLPYLDTGALYRAIAWKLDKEGVAPEEGERISKALASFRLEFSCGGIMADGTDVTAAIRTPEIDRIVSAYAARAEVRGALIELQRAQAVNGLVADGRDMGTVVFPDAELKIFLTASPEVRARRRLLELEAKGIAADYEKVLEDIRYRDSQDSSRAAAPLKQAEDAVLLDTSDFDFERSVAAVLAIIAEKTA